MTLLIDTGPVVALADAQDPRREEILEVLQSEPGALIIPAPATAEIDYLLGQRFGPTARRAFLGDLAAGRFVTACLERDDYVNVVELETRYADHSLGLVDCSLLVLADRLKTTRLLTFDERHFRATTTLSGQTLTLLPADA